MQGEQAELQGNVGQEESKYRSRRGGLGGLTTKEESSIHSGGKGAGGANAGRKREKKRVPVL